MYKLILAALLTTLLVSTSYASDMEKFFGRMHNIDDNFFMKSCGEECLQIETRGGAIFRVYACGQLEKQDWKELNKNEEPGVTVSSGTTLTAGSAAVWESTTTCWDLATNAPCE